LFRMIALFSRASIQMHARVKHFSSFNSIFMIDHETSSYLTVQFCTSAWVNATSRLYSLGATSISFGNIRALLFSVLIDDAPINSPKLDKKYTLKNNFNRSVNRLLRQYASRNFHRLLCPVKRKLFQNFFKNF